MHKSNINRFKIQNTVQNTQMKGISVHLRCRQYIFQSERKYEIRYILHEFVVYLFVKQDTDLFVMIPTKNYIIYCYLSNSVIPDKY